MSTVTTDTTRDSGAMKTLSTLFRNNIREYGMLIALSVGSVVAVVGALAGVLIVRYDVNWVLTILICLLVGAAIGAFQGFWVAYVKIPAFIVTLAGMLIFRGLTIALLQGESVGPFPTGFQKISSGFIP